WGPEGPEGAGAGCPVAGRAFVGSLHGMINSSAARSGDAAAAAAAAAASDVDVATAAAQAGAEVVRTLYGQELARIDKGAGDFATAADVAAEKAVLDVLRAARPADAVLGEEGGQQGAGAADGV